MNTTKLELLNLSNCTSHATLLLTYVVCLLYRFELEFWDELAEIAAHHVKKGDQIFVTGRIIVDKAVTPEATYTRVKVVILDLMRSRQLQTFIIYIWWELSLSCHGIQLSEKIAPCKFSSTYI